VDLHFTSASANATERDAVDAMLEDRPNESGATARSRRHLLLPVLHAMQERVGWISPAAVNYIGERLAVAPADIYGVATFYKLFQTQPLTGGAEGRPPPVAHLCDDIACLGAGADRIFADVASWQEVRVERSPCLGLCDRAPAALVIRAGESPSAIAMAPIATPGLRAAIDSGSDGSNHLATHVGGSESLLLRRVGRVDPESLDDYRAHGGYAALQRAFELGPEKTIDEIAEAKLLGRGGAAFPAAKKMEAVAAEPGRPHYMLCNADESEPGTFKDRVLMEGDPFAVVEATTIAAYAVGCEHAYVYLRGEYPLAARRIEGAIAQARSRGLLGDNVMGSGRRLEIELRRGAGAYICGEETALFNSIEGKRGEPRNKPPFPAQAGLFGKPTLVNNVETLVNLLPILVGGGAAYARIGTPQSTGTRLFSLSGAIARPGVYEVAHGTTLRRLIELAGGIATNSTVRAILLGGAAGTLLAPQSLDLPLTFEDARAAGTTLGSGVVMLFDERTDLERVVRRIARFFRDESCGQCVPCRIGTVRQEEALERGDAALLPEIARVMRDASICGLGQTAASVVESARANLGLFAEKPS
jgi:NADH-quinone oxidoreductase subunit F